MLLWFKHVSTVFKQWVETVLGSILLDSWVWPRCLVHITGNIFPCQTSREEVPWVPYPSLNRTHISFITWLFHSLHKRHVYKGLPVKYLPSPCWKELFYGIQKQWWLEVLHEKWWVVNKQVLDWGCMMKAHVVPYYIVPVSLMVCIIHTGVCCVVWFKVGMTVEDTMRIGDGSAQCDVPTTLARNIYNGSVANDIFSPSYDLC